MTDETIVPAASTFAVKSGYPVTRVRRTER